MKRADTNQKSLVVDILTKSFDDNKSVNYVVKQDSNRQARIRGLMNYSFDICNAFGDVWMADDDQACALVLYPDKKRSTLNAILWDAKLAVSVIGLSRVNQVLSRESKIKSFHPKERFTYLWFIGVTPELQNKGKGSQLLHEIISESESQNRPIYLETSVDRNLPWYQKFDFEIFQALDLTYTLYMLRRLKASNRAMNIQEFDRVEND
ncbi:MAG TPA: GNAT family N-acetyltransferase [Cyclobacteriaceae bacterium]|nr:GNAT family N-acetyltransferase [Cyclobacteriaceae bacterium]